MIQILETIMYKIRREAAQPVLPTGPNPLPPLSEFETKITNYNLTLHIPFGQYMVDIDMAAGVGFFQHALAGVNGICGQFWLAGHVVLEADHLLPADVRYALTHNAFELA